jgi:hypothetical protein
VHCRQFQEGEPPQRVVIFSLAPWHIEPGPSRRVLTTLIRAWSQTGQVVEQVGHSRRSENDHPLRGLGPNLCPHSNRASGLVDVCRNYAKAISDQPASSRPARSQLQISASTSPRSAITCSAANPSGGGASRRIGVLVAQALLGAGKVKRACASPSAQGREIGSFRAEPRILTPST